MDVLFELIKSLSPAEKGYIKKFAGRVENGEGNNNIRLLEILDGQEIYNEANAKKQLGKEKNANQFSVAKNYLYNAILKALTAYNEEHSLETILRNHFSQIEILTHRGLIQQALKTAQRGKQLALKLERFDSVLQFNALQRTLLLKAKPDDESLSQSYLLKEFKRVTEQQKQISNLEITLQEQNALINTSMNVRNAQALQLNKKLFASANKNSEAITSQRGRHLLHCIRLNYYLHTDKRTNAFNEARKLLAICNGFDYFAKYDSLSLLNAYNQFLHAAFYVGEWHELEEKLKELQQLKLRNELDKVWQFCYYAPYALAYFDKAHNTTQVEKLFRETEVQLKLHRDKLRPDIFFGLIISFSSGLLEYGKYAKAIDWIEIYRNAPRLKQHYDNQSSVLLLQLIAHYELGNTVLITGIIKNVEYFINTNSQKSIFENLVIKFFRTLITKGKSEKATVALTKIAEEFKQLASGNVANKNRVIYPVMLTFMQSKLLQQPYHLVAKGRV